MKCKISLFLLFIGLAINGQTVLTFDTHCYKNNVNYSYHLVEYTSPGEAGARQVWDFSGAKADDTLNGEMQVEAYALNKTWFPTGNVSVQEFGHRFIFESSPDGMKQVGFLSNDEKTVVQYDEPVVKLKFPMQYTDRYKGEFMVRNLLVNTAQTGTYTVTADAYGTLILPDFKTFENALRVHSFMAVSRGDGSVQESNVYRWYIASERFPVMVIQEIVIKRQQSVASTTYKAAYNTNITALKSAGLTAGFSVQPNPATQVVHIRFTQPENGPVLIQLFNLDGKLVETLHSSTLPKGQQQVSYQIDKSGIAPGAYVLKIQSSGAVQTSPLIIQQ